MCYIQPSRAGLLSPPARPMFTCARRPTTPETLEESPDLAPSHAAARRTFSRLENPLDVPNLIDIQRRSFAKLTDTEERHAPRDDRRRLADHRLHGEPRHRLRRLPLRRPGQHDRRVPREGHHLLAPAQRRGRLPEPRDRRDPRADRLHGRLPVDDRSRHVHHQRHRARRRHAARPFPRRLRDGPEGPREAGLHRQPDAGPRLLAGARDRQEGPRLRPHRPQAQAAGHRAAARDGLRLRRADPRDVRQLGLHAAHDRRRHRRRRRPRRAP